MDLGLSIFLLVFILVSFLIVLCLYNSAIINKYKELYKLEKEQQKGMYDLIEICEAFLNYNRNTDEKIEFYDTDRYLKWLEFKEYLKSHKEIK